MLMLICNVHPYFVGAGQYSLKFLGGCPCPERKKENKANDVKWVKRRWIKIVIRKIIKGKIM
jgi:hypothetical protein